MTIRDFLAAQLGGAIPLVTTNRTVHAVDGATYRIELVWFRRRFGQDYHTPKLPRSIRIERAQYARRLHLLAAADSMREAATGIRRIVADTRNREAEKLAAGHRFVAGDIVPSWVREIPPYVLEVCDTQDDVWRRPADDDDERIHDGQEYDWVQVSRANQDEISGHTTNEGLYDWAPVTVTKVAVEIGDAHHTV